MVMYYDKQKAYKYSEDAFLTNPVASATDCTGYVQRVPENSDEAESYEEIYDVPVSSPFADTAVPPAR